MLNCFFNDAKAIINSTSKEYKIKGTVYFRQTKKGVIITAKIYGLPGSNTCAGKFFGFHIHDGTSCESNTKGELTNVKGHYNSIDCPHPLHKGDLPPLIENNGYAYMVVLINKFTVEEIIGKVIIIHESVDNFTTQPSGNSKNKIACGKIE